MPKKRFNKKRPFFQHYVIELFNVDRNLLIKDTSVSNYIKKFIEKLKEKVVYSTSYNFTPYGTTLIFVLRSSHLIVHTWPASNYLHIDFLTCFNPVQPTILSEYIKSLFKIKDFKIKLISY